eukprot:PhM_4_TR13942/c3_g1_i3/m.5367
MLVNGMIMVPTFVPMALMMPQQHQQQMQQPQQYQQQQQMLMPMMMQQPSPLQQAAQPHPAPAQQTTWCPYPSPPTVVPTQRTNTNAVAVAQRYTPTSSACTEASPDPTPVNVKCFTCGSHGHKARHCPANPQTASVVCALHRKLRTVRNVVEVGTDPNTSLPRYECMPHNPCRMLPGDDVAVCVATPAMTTETSSLGGSVASVCSVPSSPK